MASSWNYFIFLWPVVYHQQTVYMSNYALSELNMHKISYLVNGPWYLQPLGRSNLFSTCHLIQWYLNYLWYILYIMRTCNTICKFTNDSLIICIFSFLFFKTLGTNWVKKLIKGRLFEPCMGLNFLVRPSPLVFLRYTARPSPLQFEQSWPGPFTLSLITL